LRIRAENLATGDCKIVTRSYCSHSSQMGQSFPSQYQSTKSQRKQQFPINNQTQFNPAHSYYKPADNQSSTLHFNSYEEPKVTSSGGGSSDLVIYIAGAFFTTEDIYNNFGHNHTTYRTTKGLTKNIHKANGVIRSARAGQFAKISSVVKWVGTAGSVFVVVVAAYNIADDVRNDRSVSGWDIADGSVGAAGLASAGLTSAGIISNPAGWAIGVCAALYGWTRLWFDLGTKYGPSTWYGNNDYKWFE